jgi:hypothetical protein
MGDVVWVSNAMNDTRLVKAMWNDWADKDHDHLVAIQQAIQAGQPLSVSEFPQAIWARSAQDGREIDLGGLGGNGPIKHLPHLFFGYGFWVVSQAAADVLRQCDLGGGGLYPVKIFQKDRKTQVEGAFFCLNFGNVKHAFLPGHSTNIMDWPVDRWRLGFVPKDYDAEVSNLALVGPDIWIDPSLAHSFFISDRLRSTLKKAKLDGAFRLFKCRVVDAN